MREDPKAGEITIMNSESMNMTCQSFLQSDNVFAEPDEKIDAFTFLQKLSLSGRPAG